MFMVIAPTETYQSHLLKVFRMQKAYFSKPENGVLFSFHFHLRVLNSKTLKITQCFQQFLLKDMTKT